MPENPAIFRRQPQQQRSQVRMQQILVAAAEVFWELGYEAASTHDIAERAQTAVGTIYRFFPNKLAIFHALEQEHRQNVERINGQLLQPEVWQQPIAVAIRQMVETYAEYFENPSPRVVYVQYFITPELFSYFDESFNAEMIRQFAAMLRSRTPTLSQEKSELLGQVVHQSYTALLLVALRSDEPRRSQIHQEMQDLLTNYLRPHVGDDPTEIEETITDPLNQQVRDLVKQHSLNSRQQKALDYLHHQGSLTIQDFETLCPERSRRTLQRDLKQLAAIGLIQGSGETNLLTYSLRDNSSDIL